jgi:hypothetical protein
VGVEKLRTFVGSKFIRNVTVRKASSDNLRGMEALVSKASPTSKMRRRLRSAEPFYW